MAGESLAQALNPGQYTPALGGLAFASPLALHFTPRQPCGLPALLPDWTVSNKPCCFLPLAFAQADSCTCLWTYPRATSLRKPSLADSDWIGCLAQVPVVPPAIYDNRIVIVSLFCVSLKLGPLGEQELSGSLQNPARHSKLVPTKKGGGGRPVPFCARHKTQEP